LCQTRRAGNGPELEPSCTGRWPSRLEHRHGAQHARESARLEAFLVQRVDFYDKNSNRIGYAVVNPKTGRVDTYDRVSNRLGYGQLSTDGRPVDFYDTQGNRLGRGEVSPSAKEGKR